MSDAITIPIPETIIFFGGGDLLSDIIRECKQNSIDCSVFTASRLLSDKIDGKTFSAILDQLKIPYHDVDDINGCLELRSSIKGNALGLGFGETYSFNTETISLFDGHLYDFMTIKLPRYRGGAHFTWQILKGDRLGAWNIQRINEQMIPAVFDSGEILMTLEYALDTSARIPKDIFDAGRKAGLQLFRDFFKRIKSGDKFSFKKLDESTSTYFPRLNTARHGWINWSWDAREIERFICAFDDPYQGASTMLNGGRVRLSKVRLDNSEGEFHPFMQGLIYRKSEEGVHIALRDGSLIATSVIDENAKDISKSVRLGSRMYTPLEQLEDAMLFNAEYDAKGLKKS